MSKNNMKSPEEKEIIVKRYLNGESTTKLADEFNVSRRRIYYWVKDYEEKGLENQKKPGNLLCKYSNKKNLTDIEKLEYENMKLRIENERLKKGYLVKGDGSVVVFKK